MPLVNIACTACGETFRGSDDVKNTRIRCPLCGAAFVVKGFVADDAPVAAKPKPKAKTPIDDDDDDNPNPYGVRTLDLRPRCPNCANELEHADAIICLFCGYNTQTRTLGKTRKVVHQTGIDKSKWLMPGIMCLVGFFLLILSQLLYVIGLAGLTRASLDYKMFNFLPIWWLICSEPCYLWSTMMTAGLMWALGRFAFKRLILEPTPPEAELD
jgi:DNA-directed RNA polymerase subunit RPC12/RpoP